MPRYDYVAVGHVTVDVLEPNASRGPGGMASDPAASPHPGGTAFDPDASRHPGGTAFDPAASRRPGGTVFYSALQAARLGLRTLILTKGDPVEIERLLEPYRDELDLEVLPAECTTTLRTWGEGPDRRQRLLAWAGPIEGPIEVDTAILHLAPVAHEIPRECFDAHPPRAEFVGLTPQGLLREWNARGDIALTALRRELLPERCDAIVLSAAEWERCEAPIPTSPAGGVLVAVTSGARPVTLHLLTGETLRVPVHPIESPRDDLGAGDVFAAALFVALREGRPPAMAAAFASAAAAVRIAGAGPGAIGDRRAIEALLGPR